MDENEVKSYFSDKFINIFTINRFIDFDDIQNPLKANLASLLEEDIVAGDRNAKRVLLRVNEFEDKTGRVALFDKGNVHTFLDVE
mgnify:CR=1 FL=1